MDHIYFSIHSSFYYYCDHINFASAKTHISHNNRILSLISKTDGLDAFSVDTVEKLILLLWY